MQPAKTAQPLNAQPAKQLFDQYGFPINTRQVAPEKRPKGMGGGYKKIDGNGRGKTTYRDYDPITGILRIIHFDGAGEYITRRFQNVDALGVLGKEIRDGFQKHKKTAGGFQQQCIISSIAHEDIMKRCGWEAGKNGGEYDRKKFDQIINDSNEPGVIRTRPGRLSSQYRTWE